MQQEQNQAHPVQVAQEFMKRAELKGGEVEMYAQTFNYLAQILEGGLVVTPKEHLEESQKKQEALEKEIKDLNTEVKAVHEELDAAYVRLGEAVPQEAPKDTQPEEPDLVKAVVAEPEVDPALDVYEPDLVETELEVVMIDKPELEVVV